MTRVTVPVGEDIGFLPGTEEEKMAPWMGALEDNLDVLNKSDDDGGDWGRAATRDLIRSRIKVKSLNFMRGRTFLNKYLIIDEAQNLTPKQMKTLITRAGPGTKVVCLGNISQIDTPYLTEGSSGLTYVVDRFKGWEHSGHITLQRGERWRLVLAISFHALVRRAGLQLLGIEPGGPCRQRGTQLSVCDQHRRLPAQSGGGGQTDQIHSGDDRALDGRLRDPAVPESRLPARRRFSGIIAAIWHGHPELAHDDTGAGVVYEVEFVPAWPLRPGLC
jgi:hypothetical protein